MKAEIFWPGKPASGGPLIFTWCILPGAASIEVLARSGFHAVNIDMQHGIIGIGEMQAMMTAVHRAGKPVFVRPAWGDTGALGKALDAGAAAVIVPMINTASEAAELVRLGKYPPLGRRSWGAAAAIGASGISSQDYLARANDLTKVFAMIETRQALDNIDEICATPGLDGVFVGPSDLSINLSGGDYPDMGSPELIDALSRIAAAARKAGCLAGVYTPNAAVAKAFTEIGFDFMSVGSDTGILSEGATQLLDDIGLRD